MLLKTIIICSFIFVVNGTNISCPHLLRRLANNQLLFIHCVTINSVPVSMCTSCREYHENVLMAYDILAANCSSMYFDNDRINLVASVESMLNGIWVKAYCEDCFNNNNSFVFHQKNITFYDCLQGASGNECDTCNVEYMDLNSFYIHLDQHNNGEVCFDLQDSMNRTRHFWSKTLNCCKREYEMTLFTIALSLMMLLPVVFYGSSYFITIYQERRYRVLYDEPSYNTTEPSTSRQSNINNINNPTSSANNGHTTTTEPSYNTTEPSTSRQSNINNINNPTSSANNGHTTTIGINNINKNSKISEPFHKNGINTFNEDLDSSDDDVEKLK
ncbi:osteopetrosis-associated transmembrane protein 1 isoform 2-T2 [Cochliomyia hominivorax]